MAFYKNKAGQHIAVFAVDADGAPKTGDAANITATISLDADTTPDALTDENPVEIGGGVYAFDVEQAESNADLIVLIPVSATSEISLRPVIIYTEPEVRSCTVSDKTGFSLHADYDAAKTAAQAGALTTVDGIVDDIKTVTVKLDTALEADAAVYRFTANALEEGPTGAAAPSAADVADAVWDEVIAVAHVGAGSAGKLLSDVEAVAGGTDWTSGEKEQIRSALGVDGDKTAAADSEILDAIAAVPAAPAASAVADAVWEEALADHSGTAGSTAEQIANIATGSPPTAAAIRAEIDANSTQLAAILVDTGTDLPASITALGTPLQAGQESVIADGVLLRHTEDIEASAGDDTLAYAIMRSTNRTHRNVNVLETYRRDGVTLHAYQQLTPDPTGQPVSDISGAEAV